MRRAGSTVLLLALLAAGCSDDGRYSGPEAHTPEELDAVLARVDLACEPVSNNDGCEVGGLFVLTRFFATEGEQRAFVDHRDECDVTQLDYGDDGALLMGRGWVLQTLDSTDVSDLARRLGVDFIYPCDDWEP